MPTAIANGVSLYYELHGPAEAPVLVLNNGILINAATSWAFQTRALAQHYRVLQYDCRGQGQSAHPAGPYTMDQHADDLAALLAALDVERAHVAGISYGGEVAQAFALRHPARARSLILADTVSEVGPELRDVVRTWLAAAERADAQAFFDATVPWNFAPAFVAANPALLADARKRYESLDFAAVARLCVCFLETVDFTARLGEIASPACVLFGELDRLKGRAYAEILHRGLRGAELHCLLGAGHASCWERAAEFNTVVLGFLAKQS